MLLEHLLEAADPAGPELMLDLKGHDPRLPGRILAAVAGRGRITVCSQDWRLLEPLRGAPQVRVVHSVGGERALARLPREPLEGVSIHRRLLDRATVRELRDRAATVMS